MLPTLTVYYNTKCPVCNAGINHQKNRLLRAVRAGAIDFQDINTHPEALAPYGATLEDIRRRLHATDPAGTLYIGADCAIEIWRRTRGDAWLATLAALSARYPACSTTVSRTSSTPGTAARTTGRNLARNLQPGPGRRQPRVKSGPR